MGTVYEAKALRLNTTVALKETHFTEERLRRQFEREAQLLANLRHPALPRVIDHFDDGDGLYLVMDFVEGDDLWEMLKKRGEPFPVEDVLTWAGQLLDALEYLHTREPPVIHRDIKPQNLKLTEDGRIILLDFGLAKGMSDGAASQMASRTVMGFSLPYAPLEQILQIDENAREQLSVLNPQEVERIRRTGTGQRSDLYSAGATLLHLLTAKVPTTSPTRATSIWSNQPDPLKNALAQGAPVNLRSFLDSSMALDPERRFASAAEMRKSLNSPAEDFEDDTLLAPTILSPTSETGARQSKAGPSERAAVESQGRLTETQRHYLEYWTAFLNYMERRGSFIAPTKPQPKYWLSFRVERGFEFGVHNTLRGREISVELYLSGSDVRSHFHLLHRDREQIERQIGTSLEWQEKPTQKNSRVITRNRSKIDPKNSQDWLRQHEWLLDKLEAFHKVFAPRIRAIRAADQLEGWTG
jgi:serine/threonine protein kinase